MIEKSKYLIAPKDWEPDSKNPFETSGSYDGYTAIYYIDDLKKHYINGTSKSGLYLVKLHREGRNSAQMVTDFINYENSFGRKVILGSENDMDIVFHLNSLDAVEDTFTIRETDLKVLVHSTNLNAWKSIQRDMKLKSSLQLHRESIKHISIGFGELKEPEEYKDFVMFGSFGHHPEFIVQSQQHGKIFMDENAPYAPGVRLYLDCHKMIRDRIIHRDGLHTIKVRKSLDLTRYLLYSCSVEDLDSSQPWTPKTFAEECDSRFEKEFGSKYDDQ